MMAISLSTADWLQLFTQFLSLSLLAVGGAITAAPDMHRMLVIDHHWLSDAQFSSSIALAQAAPGPNTLFIALMGWNVGLNAGNGAQSWVLATLGMTLSMLGMLLPSTVLTVLASQWGHRNRELRAVRALKAGLAPIVVALLVSTGWLLTTVHDQLPRDAGLWLLALASALLVWRTKIHLLILLAAGALLGALGWV